MSATKLKKIVTLVITQNCNLACTYCYEHNKTRKTMPIEIAKNIINQELTVNDGYDEVIFEFFGGEPFLEFEIIKELYDFIWDPKFTKKRLCFVSTNGTLLTSEMKQWLYPRREHIVCGLSADGTKSMHDINRCCSFDSIDFTFFKNTWPDQTVKMTISIESLPSLAEGVIFLHQKGFGVTANLAHGLDWGTSWIAETLETELEKLVQYYVDNPQISPCSMLSMCISRLGTSDVDSNKRWCGTGTHMKTYDIDGSCYPCQMFLPISSGENSESFVSINFQDDTCFTDPYCNNCPIEAICPNCYGMNFNIRGNPAIRDHNLCKLMKLNALAVSKLEFMKIDKYGLSSVGEAEAQYKMLKGIDIIQNTLSV